MTLLHKLYAALSLLVTLGALFLVLASVALGQREQAFLQEAGREVEGRLNAGVALTSQGALDQALAYAGDAEVIEAFSLANRGDIGVDEDPVVEAARRRLRAHIASQRRTWERQRGGELRVHFHLPTSRSFLRAWKDDQRTSDDLSAFRATLNVMAKEHQPIVGLEVGKGGFLLRGIAPIESEAGQYLGTVEVQRNYSDLVGELSGDVQIYMTADLLKFATDLQDPTKYPVVGGRFVRVSSEGDWVPPASLLAEGVSGGAVITSTARNHFAFPIADYSGETVGVAVVSADQSSLQRAMSLLRLLGVVGVSLSVLAVASGGWWLVSVNVLRPVRSMTQMARAIAGEGADPETRLQVRGRDELAELGVGFNLILDKISALVAESQVLAQHLKHLPLPVVEINRDFSVAFANDAALKLLGKTADQCVGTKCYELFRTDACQRNCAVERSMREKREIADETRAHLWTGTENIPIRYTGVPLRGPSGEVTGALDVVSDLSALYGVLGEVREVSETTSRASEELASASSRMNDGAQRMATSSVKSRQAVEELADNLGIITASTEEMNQSVSSVAAAVEQMTSTLAEVAANTSVTSQVAQRVELHTKDAIQAMVALQSSARSIGRVVEVIADVAGQTNLLALNASIEAASAGVAGRGFAVVANEVKALAGRTSAATGEIRDQIEAMQLDTTKVAEVMAEVATSITELSALSHGVAAAMEEQSSALVEISNSTAHVSSLADGVARQVTLAHERSMSARAGIQSVSEGVSRTTSDISVARGQASGLSELAARLKDKLTGFKLLR
ncbi:MAG: PAS domain-containing protein [Deltaproteobacteria bacterium]|nr:PAS domain-containing protein [Deltaproteobacteria bacterium]